MKIPRLRALVLTAGFGYRLRPLTLFLPKGLLPVCGEAVAGHTLKQIARSGCRAVALNLHHLADAIPEHFGESYQQLPITYSNESEIQGTLGALYPLRDFLSRSELIAVINGDTLCHWPLKAMIRAHVRSGADATMLLHRRPPEEVLGGPVGIDSRGRVVQLRDAAPTGEIARRHLFAGAHILSSRLLDRIREGAADIVADLYIPLLQEGRRIQSTVTGRRWHDLGTPERYLAASLDWARYRKTLGALGTRTVVSPHAELDGEARVHRSIVETGAVVGADTVVEASLLLPGARVSSGSTIRNSIIGPNVELPDGACIESRMVTRRLSGHQPEARDTVLADLVYTPLRSN